MALAPLSCDCQGCMPSLNGDAVLRAVMVDLQWREGRLLKCIVGDAEPPDSVRGWGARVGALEQRGAHLVAWMP